MARVSALPHRVRMLILESCDPGLETPAGFVTPMEVLNSETSLRRSRCGCCGRGFVAVLVWRAAARFGGQRFGILGDRPTAASPNHHNPLLLAAGSLALKTAAIGNLHPGATRSSKHRDRVFPYLGRSAERPRSGNPISDEHHHGTNPNYTARTSFRVPRTRQSSNWNRRCSYHWRIRGKAGR